MISYNEAQLVSSSIKLCQLQILSNLSTVHVGVFQGTARWINPRRVRRNADHPVIVDEVR